MLDSNMTTWSLQVNFGVEKLAALNSWIDDQQLAMTLLIYIGYKYAIMR